MTGNEKVAVMAVRLRLAGVHPQWVKWFCREHGNQLPDLEYVLDAVEHQTPRGEVYLSAPSLSQDRVHAYLRENP